MQLQAVFALSSSAVFPYRFTERGVADRIDHRSHDARGFDELPTIHDGVSARTMEMRGVAADRCEWNREIKAENRILRELKAKLDKLLRTSTVGLLYFDPMLAAVLGFSPALVHYGLMTLVSLTIVGAFQSVGSVLVIAFMIGPPVTAYLLTDDLKRMLILSGAIGAVNGILGYQAAALLDVSIAGSMAVMTGLVFLAVFIFAPRRGLISALLRRRNQKIEFAKATLLFHLYNHEGDVDEVMECGVNSIQTQLHWGDSFAKKILAFLKQDENISFSDGVVKLTDKGRLNSINDCENLFS